MVNQQIYNKLRSLGVKEDKGINIDNILKSLIILKVRYNLSLNELFNLKMGTYFGLCFMSAEGNKNA